MITALFIAFSLPSPGLGQDGSAFTQRAEAFVKAARSGWLADSYSGSILPLTEQRNLDERVVQIAMGNVNVRIDRSTGCICWFSDDHEVERRADRSPNQLTREQLATLADRYYKKAGYTEDLLLYQVDETDDGAVQVFDLHLLPLIEGVPVGYDDHVFMSVEHVSGKLMSFHRGLDLPRKSSSLVPALSLEEGRARVLEGLFGFRPSRRGVYERQPLRLIIWRPTEASADSFSTLTSQEIDAGKQGHGRLAYWAYYHDLASRGTPGGPRAYDVFLDASTGRMLKIEPVETGGGGSASSGKAGLSLDFPEGPMSVLVKGKWVKVRASIQASGIKGAVSESAKPVTLGIGRAYIRATFDPESGLLHVRRGGSIIYGRPSESLRRVLAKG